MKEFLLAMSIPSAIFTAVLSLGMWWFKKYIDKRDAKRCEKEKNTEQLMIMIMQTARATNILAEATARAVQRIPDAHCNGDMKTALEQAEKVQSEEKDFLIDQGVKHIFGD